VQALRREDVDADRRVLTFSHMKTSDEPMLFLVDVLEEAEGPLSGPEGESVEPPADAPAIVEEGDKVTGVDFSDAPKDPPGKLQVIPLIEGEGPEVEEGQQVALNYLGVVWGEDKPFDSSYERGEPTAGGRRESTTGWRATISASLRPWARAAARSASSDTDGSALTIASSVARLTLASATPPSRWTGSRSPATWASSRRWRRPRTSSLTGPSRPR